MNINGTSQRILTIPHRQHPPGCGCVKTSLSTLGRVPEVDPEGTSATPSSPASTPRNSKGRSFAPRLRLSDRLCAKRQRRPTFLPNRKGMTLIEVVIVAAIMAGLFVGAAYLFNSLNRANLKAQGLRLTGYIKYTYGQAAIQQRYHRMIVDLDAQEYWVEAAEKGQVGLGPALPTANPHLQDSQLFAPPGGAPSSAPGAPRKERKGAYDADDDEGGTFGLQKGSFSAVSDRLAKRRKLESGIRIHSVTTSYDQGPVESGRVAITFYPNGFVDRSQIMLNDGGDGFLTMEIQPLTGKVDLRVGQHEADRDFFEVEDDD